MCVFWDSTQRIMVITYRNFGKELLLCAAEYPSRAQAPYTVLSGGSLKSFCFDVVFNYKPFGNKHVCAVIVWFEKIFVLRSYG
jgi:hypothetical protein